MIAEISIKLCYELLLLYTSRLVSLDQLNMLLFECLNGSDFDVLLLDLFYKTWSGWDVKFQRS